MKKGLLNALLDSIFIILFNVLFFVLGGTDHPASVWISYGFIHFAYLMVVLTPVLTQKTASREVFGLVISSISTIYFVVEFIIGVLFILIAFKAYKGVMLFQIVIAGIYLFFLVANLLANEHTATSEKRHAEEIEYIKSASSRVRMLLDKTSDKNTNRAIERAYDILHSSPAKTVPSVELLESNILDKVTELEIAVKNNNIEGAAKFASRIVELTEERNRQISMNN